jgi:DNA-directed RNA polymerase specialized sigma24 family protein
MEPLSSNRALTQLSHRELIHKLQADPGHQPAVREFISRYDTVIRRNIISAIYKRGKAAGNECMTWMIDDFVNEIYCRLFRRDCQALRAFRCRYKSSIFAYLRAICWNMVRYQLRNDLSKNAAGRRYSIDTAEEKWGGLSTEQVPASLCSAVAQIEAVERSDLERMIYANFHQIFCAKHAKRNFIIFKLHFLHGYHCHEIACIKSLGLRTKGVNNAAARIRHWLRREFCNLAN